MRRNKRSGLDLSGGLTHAAPIAKVYLSGLGAGIKLDLWITGSCAQLRCISLGHCVHGDWPTYLHIKMQKK